MDKTQKYKKMLIFAGAIVLFVIVIVFALKSCGREKDSENHDGDIGQEVMIEEKESEEGLDIAGAEDADASDSQGAVEFIGPDEAASGDTTSDKSEDVTDDKTASDSGNNENADHADNTENTEKDEETEGNENSNSGLDEEMTESNTGKYGTFF